MLSKKKTGKYHLYDAETQTDLQLPEIDSPYHGADIDIEYPLCQTPFVKGGIIFQSTKKPNSLFGLLCAAGRNRTDMGLLPHDFESCASTSFTTAAYLTKTSKPAGF